MAILQSDAFWGVAIPMLFVLGGGVLYVSIRRERSPFRPPVRDPRTDLAGMMILFQTMRDILAQQKDVAREVNRGIELKVSSIKEAADTAKADLEKVQAAARDLFVLLEETRAELAALHNRVGTGGEPIAASPRRPVLQARGLPLQEARPLASQPKREPPATGDDAPALRIVAQPEPTSVTGRILDKWVGLDFAGDAPDPNAFDVPEHVPEAPEDVEAAREAFRALLNLDTGASSMSSGAHGSPAQEPARGNGRDGLTPVQARVYEYSDAGMSVPQIARELGMGKGEIRLILSLRKDRERHRGRP